MLKIIVFCFLHPVDWERKARRLLREYGAGETPQALKRRGGSPARPKVREVPGAEINRQFLTQPKK